MTSAHIAEAVAWFAVHETDRRGPAGSPYELMRRDFALSFDEACTVCREVRRIVGPYPSTPGGRSPSKSDVRKTARAVFSR